MKTDKVKKLNKKAVVLVASAVLLVVVAVGGTLHGLQASLIC